MTAPASKAARLPRPLIAFGVAAALFIIVEVALQVRAHLRFGQSIFNTVQGESAYRLDPLTGLTLLAPNSQSGGKLQVIRSNRYGLRSPDIQREKPAGTLRVAVLGASTVFGAYAPNNEATFPGRLERLLRERMPERPIEVINAGIPGFGLASQARIFEKLVADFAPDITVVYPGFNDFAGYCREAKRGPVWTAQPLVGFELPDWLLSVELLLKNTVALRTKPEGLQPAVDVGSLDLDNYRRQVRALLETLRRSGTGVILATNARSYRPDQPLSVQRELSETARFYSPCFDIGGLHLLYERHNDALAAEAGALGVPVVTLDKLIPGGRAYFVDASHFSEKGEQIAAEELAKVVMPRLVQAAGLVTK